MRHWLHQVGAPIFANKLSLHRENELAKVAEKRDREGRSELGKRRG